MREECRTNRQCPFDRFFYSQFLEIAARSVVMPATPEARVMWPPYTKALTAIVRRNADVAGTLKEADWEISRYIGACTAGAQGGAK